MAAEKHPENCKEIFAMLSEYLDAELNAETCAEIEQHLAGCPPCIEFLNTLKRTVRLCHGYESAEQPPPIQVEQMDELRTAYRKMLAATRRD